jgi:hypothetical protein
MHQGGVETRSKGGAGGVVPGAREEGSFLEVPTEFFKGLLDKGAGFASKTVARRFQN